MNVNLSILLKTIFHKRQFMNCIYGLIITITNINIIKKDTEYGDILM